MNPVHSLSGRRVVVGVSGSIAAYKSVLLVRLLVRAGAEVKVLMTPAATKFVAPLTFSTLSKHAVLTSVTSEEGWNDHVALGLWGDAYVIAPATANTIGRLANGLCDTILAAVYLSARCPVLLAPAMDVDMWAHPSTQANVARLASYGNHIIPVGEGELASGLNGAGRLAEPEDIVSAITAVLAQNTVPAQVSEQPLAGKRVLLTAGPTHEPIDPVRFIGNRSSGKTGVAIAAALVNLGAEVELIIGPAFAKPAPHPRLNVTHVQTAVEMHTASLAVWDNCDAAVLAAAVADYRPSQAADEKIKKGSDPTDAGISLDLVRTPDIAATLGASKRSDQRVIGFALETSDGIAHATDKLVRKHLDAIVLNVHTPEAKAFGGDDNAVTIVYPDGRQVPHPRSSKETVGEVVAALVAELLLPART